MENEFKCNIIQKIGVLSTKDNGYNKQINLISWNDRAPKLDIREWSSEGRASKGITMTKEEGKALYEALKSYYTMSECPDEDCPFSSDNDKF